MNRSFAIALLVVMSLLVVVFIGTGIWSVIKDSKQPVCDMKVCHNLCTEMGGFASRILNADSRNRDGWIDCKCVGTVHARDIPIKLEEIEAGCK